MLLLSKRKYYTQARFGYVRGSEPVQYVRQIEDRYFAYVKQLPVEKAVTGLRNGGAGRATGGLPVAER